MNAIATHIRSLSESLLPALASLTSWATILLAAAWLATMCFRRQPAAVRYCVWQFAFVGLVALPLIYASLPGRPLGFSLPSGAGTALDEAYIRRPTVAPPPGRDGRAADTLHLGASQTPLRLEPDDAGRARTTDSRRQEHQPARHPADGGKYLDSVRAEGSVTPSAYAVTARERPMGGAHWPAIVVVAWTLGLASNLAWLVRSHIAARLMLSGAKHVAEAASFGVGSAPVASAAGFSGASAPGAEAASFVGASWQLALRTATAPVLISSNTQVPVALGVFRPRILLPPESVTWPPARLGIALAHEQAHVERQDVFWQLIARFAASLYWFHPLTWISLRKMRIERERACDDQVLLTGVSPQDYAAGLVEVAAALRGRKIHLLGGLGMVDRSQLAGRVCAILNKSLLRGPASRRLRYGMVLATVCVVLLLGLLRPFSPLPRGIAQTTQPEQHPTSEEQADRAKAPDTDPQPKVPENHTTTSGAIVIQVVGPDGEPLEGAHIHASVWSDEPFPGNRDYATDKDGLALVELPRVIRILRVWARHKGHVPLFAQWWPEEQKDGHEIPEAFMFSMQKGTQMGGIVTNEDGEAIEGVIVEIRRDSGGVYDKLAVRPILGTWLAEGDGPDGALTTDSQGRWELNNVPPGDDVEIRVKLSHPDYINDEGWGGLQREQHVPMQAFRDQTATIVMQRGITVTGKVTDPDGNPVDRAVVVWGNDPYSQTGSQEVLTDENGDYRFPPLPPRDEKITVIARGWMPDLREIKIAHDMKPVDFELKPGMTLRIQFVDMAGQPIPGVGVGLGNWRGGKSIYNHQHPNVIYTAIPQMADQKGIYEWTWAPDDPVDFYFWHENFDGVTMRLIAGEGEHLQILRPALRIRGRVTDSVTGGPIEQFTVVPLAIDAEGVVRAHRPGTEHRGGEYSFTFNQKDWPAYRMQVEAIGYRTAISDVVEIDNLQPTCDFSLQPAPPETGRVVDKDGTPVVGAMVFLASKTQGAFHLLSDDSSGNFRVNTDAKGEFAFPAQLEPYTIIVTHDVGCAERAVPWNEQPGEIKLQDWAEVTGVYYHDGRQVPAAPISLYEIRALSENSPVISTSIISETDGDGRFTFSHVLPGKYHLRPYYSTGWENSRQAVPLELSAGQHLEIDLGVGARVTGRVTLVGPALRDWSVEESQHYMFRREDGIEPPAEVAALGYDWRRGWNEQWFYTGRKYLETLHHYTVQPQADGTFVIDGVPAGEYELALRIFAPPNDGMNLHPIATRSVRLSVTTADVQRGTLDVGRIEMKASLGIQPGDPVLDFQYQTLNGDARQLSDLHGRHVLIHFWESQRVRGIEKLPEFQQLYDEYGDNERLLILGLSFDRDLPTLRRFLDQRKLPWEQGFLGFPPATDVPERLGVFNFPAFFLIDPDGKPVHKGHSADEVRKHLDAELAE